AHLLRRTRAADVEAADHALRVRAHGLAVREAQPRYREPSEEAPLHLERRQDHVQLDRFVEQEPDAASVLAHERQPGADRRPPVCPRPRAGAHAPAPPPVAGETPMIRLPTPVLPGPATPPIPRISPRRRSSVTPSTRS